MKTAADYRIEQIQLITLSGKRVKAFQAYVRQDDRFVFLGAFTAHPRTPNKDLWLIPNASDTGSVDE